jgi:hypothetical protein
LVSVRRVRECAATSAMGVKFFFGTKRSDPGWPEGPGVKSSWQKLRAENAEGSFSKWKIVSRFEVMSG